MAAATSALLRSETRHSVVRAATRDELAAGDPDVVVADGGFLRDHGPLPPVPAVVLLDPTADQSGLPERAPGARGWLPTTATGDDLLAAVEAAAGRVPPKPAPAPVGPVEPPPPPRESVALVVAGVAFAALALSFLWLMVRP